MKKFFFLFVLIAGFASAQKVNFSKDKFSVILEKADKEGKLVFLDAYAEWCGPCKLMDKTVFTNTEVADFYNKNFVNAQIDMEKGEGPGLAARYGIQAYPSLLFINGKGEVVHKFIGYYDAKKFLQIGKDIGGPENQPANLVKRFQAGESNPEFLLELIRKTATTDYDVAKKASEKYFAQKKDGDFSSEEASWLLYFIKSPADANYKVFQEHKNGLIKQIPENKYNEFDVNLKLIGITEKSIDPKTLKLDEQYFLTEAVQKVGKENAEAALLRLKINFYLHLRNNVEYQKAALEYYKDPQRFEADELSTAAWNFYNLATDDAALKTALSWAMTAVAKKENAKTTLVLALLHKKSGDKAQALTAAKKSLELHAKEQLEPRAVQSLIKELSAK